MHLCVSVCMYLCVLVSLHMCVYVYVYQIIVSAFKSTIVVFCAFFLWLAFFDGLECFLCFFFRVSVFLHNVYIQIQCKVLNSKVELPS